MKTHIDGQGLNVSAAQSKSLIQQKKKIRTQVEYTMLCANNEVAEQIIFFLEGQA